MGITPKEACKKHRGEDIYEVYVYEAKIKIWSCFQSKQTDDVYLTLEEAKEAARTAAHNIAWREQLQKLDHPEYDTEFTALLACVISGRKVSKKGNIYGFRKVVYAVSHQTKEVTDRFTLDEHYNGPQPDEYTEQPKLTKDMFYQWKD